MTATALQRGRLEIPNFVDNLIGTMQQISHFTKGFSFRGDFFRFSHQLLHGLFPVKQRTHDTGP
jgi:hypothetical protein